MNKNNSKMFYFNELEDAKKEAVEFMNSLITNPEVSSDSIYYRIRNNTIEVTWKRESKLIRIFNILTEDF